MAYHLLGMLIMATTLWAFFVFTHCSRKVAPSSAGMIVLLVFMFLSVLIVILACIGLFVFFRETVARLNQFLRALFIFVVLSLLLMVALWIYTCYTEYKWYRNTMQLAYLCFQDVADCWDEIQKSHSCCGWESPKDWKAIPMSCCDHSLDRAEEFCKKDFNTWIPLEVAFTKGCRKHLYFASLIHILVVTTSWVIVFVMNLLVLFFGIHILRGMKIKERNTPKG